MATAPPGRPLRTLQHRPSVDPGEAKAAAERSRALVVPASSILDGTLLPRLAAEHRETFRGLLPSRPLAVGRKLLWASACSGSEGVHFVFQALEGVLVDPAALAPTSFSQCFACESHPEKRRWIQSVIAEQGGDHRSTCIFEDIAHLSQTSAACVVHNRRCPVPDVDIFVCGTSCKDISSLSSGGRTPSGQLVFEMQSSPGGSAQTFRGFLAYIHAHRPALVLFENVEKLADEGASSSSGGATSNLDVLLAEMSGRGYEGQKFVVDSKDFGLPARRRRVYVVFVRVVGCQIFDFSLRSPVDVFVTMAKLVRVCHRSPPSFVDCLLPDDAQAVPAELARRLAAGAGSQQCSADQSWSKQMLKEYRAVGLRYGVHSADTRSLTSPWYQILSPRERGALAYSQAVTPGRAARNVGMSVHRVACSHDEGHGVHIAPTMLPNQQLWIDAPRLKHPRILLGWEALAFQGFPLGRRPDLMAFSDGLMQELAGNAMSLPVVLALLMATLVAVPWADVGEVASPTTEAQMDEALSLLMLLPGGSSAGYGTCLESVGAASSTPPGGAKRRKTKPH